MVDFLERGGRSQSLIGTNRVGKHCVEEILYYKPFDKLI